MTPLYGISQLYNNIRVFFPHSSGINLFMRMCAAYLVISLQLSHWPQFSLRQASHFPHLLIYRNRSAQVQVIIRNGQR